MSRPQNILNFFRTYSYHHILIACDGTETAQALAKESEITLFDHERAVSRFLPQSLPSNGGQYVVLINGMSDVMFTIKSAKWSSVMIPTDGQDPSTMAVDGELVITEPNGVRFLNVVSEVCSSLGTDPNGVCFMLKTIFVGHRQSGGSEIITNIKPLLFMAHDINAVFDTTGSEYVFSFVGMVNGAAKMPHISSISDGFTMYLADENGKQLTLQQALEQVLPSLLTKHYAAFKEKLITDLEKSNSTVNVEEEFQDVVYKVKIDEAYYDYFAGSNELEQKQSIGNNDPVISQEGDSISIEGLIKTIMNSSKEVVTEDKREAPGELKGRRFVPKITSTLRTGPNKYEVEYQVQRYELVTTTVEQNQNPFQFDPNDNPNLDQGIEFDYIFTGGNVDIRNFDIKMQMGMAFFQTLLTTPNYPSTVESQTQDKISPIVGGSDNAGVANGDGKPRPKKPLFLGMTSRNASFRNKKSPGDTVGFNALLERHAAYENIDARITITGNPQILEETTYLPDDIDPLKTIPAAVIKTEDSASRSIEDSPKTIIPLMHKIPGYVKVNVKMPASDESQFQDYAEPFWYQGWYYLYAVNHSFSDGEFVQELEMFSMPTDAGQVDLNNEKDDNQTQPSGESTNQTTLIKSPQEKRTVKSISKERRARAKTNYIAI